MTKTENRAAANAYHQERKRKLVEESRGADVAADLAELDRLRRYLIRGRRAHGADAEKLRSAIDDYVEQLTGDRTALHAKLQHRTEGNGVNRIDRVGRSRSSEPPTPPPGRDSRSHGVAAQRSSQKRSERDRDSQIEINHGLAPLFRPSNALLLFAVPRLLSRSSEEF